MIGQQGVAIQFVVENVFFFKEPVAEYHVADGAMLFALVGRELYAGTYTEVELAAYSVTKGLPM